MTKALVSPSILSADFVNLERDVKRLAEWGADYVHCDVMDGVYVKNLTFGMPMIKAIKRISPLPLDVHLMITRPERYLDEFVKAGADIVTFHPDASSDPEAALDMLGERGVKRGIVINPDVRLEDYIHLLPKCDVLLVMSVFAGLGGQKFIPETLETVKLGKKYISENKLGTVIEIDGGVGAANAGICRDAGVDMIVAGSAVFNASDPAAVVAALRG